jgi:hypothetical protein
MLAHPHRQLAVEALIGVFVAKVGNVGFDFARNGSGAGSPSAACQITCAIGTCSHLRLLPSGGSILTD